jgi:hypothetical protein
MSYFRDGTEPVVMACLVKGRFKSSFPEGIEVEEESSEDESGEKSEGESGEKKTAKKQLTGLAEASTECAVVVFADVDFISDIEGVAYRNTMFGMKVAVGNNSDLLFNAIDDLGGSGELIGFTVVEEIKRTAERETAEEEAKINGEIEGFRSELQQIMSSAKEGEKEVVAASIVQKQRDLELKIRQAERELRQVQKKRRERIEQLGSRLQNLNMWSAPAAILLIAIFLSIRRSFLRRRYVSHASDA